jgi:glycyl-tRNA synthetase
MEIEYFVRPEQWEERFEYLYKEQQDFLAEIGIRKERLHKIIVPAADRAHYSKHSIDTEFDFPFGQKELLGLAYRTDFDLNAHKDASKVDISYFDESETDPEKKRLVPHCIEPTFGVGRLLLAVLADAYREDNLGDEPRAYLQLSPRVAPVLVAVSPLLKNKEHLVTKAREVYMTLRKQYPGRVMFDDNGNIGKRYRRQDEIGTPFCVVIDFDTVEQNSGVTIRYRDTGEQKRVSVEELIQTINSHLE